MGLVGKNISAHIMQVKGVRSLSATVKLKRGGGVTVVKGPSELRWGVKRNKRLYKTLRVHCVGVGQVSESRKIECLLTRKDPMIKSRSLSNEG